MSYIYMDESGCLGFDLNKQGTSRHFIVTCLLTDQPRRMDKLVRKTFQAMPPRMRQGHPGCLHASREQPKIRKKLLGMLGEEHCASIIVIRLNKEHVYARLQNETVVLYNYITNILLDRILNRGFLDYSEPIQLIASKRETNRFLNENFQAYLEQSAATNHAASLSIDIQPPHAMKPLQAVDFASWAVFRYYEHGDGSYYNLIRNRLVEDKTLFGENSQ